MNVLAVIPARGGSRVSLEKHETYEWGSPD